jgi:hypothetical protein
VLQTWSHLPASHAWLHIQESLGMCESQSEVEFDEDTELNCELDKFPLMRAKMSYLKNYSYADSWKRTQES